MDRQLSEVRAALSRGEFAQAIAEAHRIHASEHDNPNVMLLLGKAFAQAGQQLLAAFYFKRALRHGAPRDSCLLDLADAYASLGEMEAADSAYLEAIKLRPDLDGLRLRRLALCRPIPRSVADIESDRSRLNRLLNELEHAPLRVSNPETAINNPGFYFSYHGRNNRPWKEAFARIVNRAAPSLSANFISEHAKSQPQRRLRVGFFSNHFRSHVIELLTRGLIAHLDRSRMEVWAISDAVHADAGWENIKLAADHLVVVAPNLEQARHQIAALNLDVLIYTDIGMHALSYYLPFARLAPVQCVMWGHPDTTGIPNVDYFISSRLIEPVNPTEHYSEKLHLLDSLPCYYYRPQLPAPPTDRSTLGLPATGNLYLCLHSQFKMHPEFDDVLRKILVADPNARIGLLRIGDVAWTTQLARRLQSSLGENLYARVFFVKARKRAEFLGLLAAGDVLLDPLHFGGGNTAYESLAMNALTVTLPGEFMRGRVMSGLYRYIGFTDLIAKTREDYAQLAVAVATQPGFKAHLKQKLAECSAKAFEDIAAVREFEMFLMNAAAAPFHG